MQEMVVVSSEAEEMLFQSFVAAVEDFTVPLRLGDGIDDAALNELKATIAAVTSTYRSVDAVPKRLAAIFVELYPAVEGTSALYEHDVAQRILAEANELLDLIMSSLRH